MQSISKDSHPQKTPLPQGCFFGENLQEVLLLIFYLPVRSFLLLNNMSILSDDILISSRIF